MGSNVNKHTTTQAHGQAKQVVKQKGINAKQVGTSPCRDLRHKGTKIDRHARYSGTGTFSARKARHSANSKLAKIN